MLADMEFYIYTQNQSPETDADDQRFWQTSKAKRPKGTASVNGETREV